MDYAKKLIITVLGIGGILVDKLSFLRVIYFLILLLSLFFYRWLELSIQPIYTVILFSSYFLIRYMFLFTCFREKGFATLLKKKYGESKGFEYYKLITALMFFHGAMIFSLMISKSGWSLLFFISAGTTLYYLGIAACLVGLTVNIWSAMLIGLDVYYYKDLFIGRPVGEFRKEGPYLLLANPMYSLGQWNGYGTALIYGSLAGVVAIMLNQVMMYIFYYTIEKPHIQKVFNLTE